MNVKYKHQEPEIVLQPNVYAMFDYIAKNVKTNLIWVCLVRKLGNKYIVEDLYFPPQNVNEWIMCNFSEDFLSRVTNSVFNYDYRICRFNMIGRFVIGKTTEIDDTAFKNFEKVMSPYLEECLMMQLNNKLEMSFAVNRKATVLSDLEYTINMDDIIDTGAFKSLLEEKVGKYTYTFESKTETSKVEKMAIRTVGEEKSGKQTIKSLLLSENLSWKTVI